MKKGFTIMELVLAMGMTVIIATVILATLVTRKSTTELDTATRHIATLLREAQGRALTRSESAGWGVHFENSTTTSPFYALFSSSYSTATRVSYNRLPPSVGYVSSSVPVGTIKEITFNQITGMPVASDSVSIHLTNDPARSSTITVSSSGAVGY